MLSLCARLGEIMMNRDDVLLWWIDFLLFDGVIVKNEEHENTERRRRGVKSHFILNEMTQS